MNRTTTRKYNHAEAFCLMHYRDADGNEETIWNSRDGVTPFIMRSRAGREMTHVNWQGDHCRPNYLPLIGDRMFVDITRERALEIAQAQVARWWDDATLPMQQHPFLGPMGRDGAAQHLVEGIYEDGHRPTLVEVTEEMQTALLASREGSHVP